MIHELKILPEYFNEIMYGRKKFEVRFNDRNFKVGDTLLLKEWENNKYTGRVIERKITYILDDTKYVKDGYVIMSIEPED